MDHSAAKALVEQYRRIPSGVKDIKESVEDGLLVLRGGDRPPVRRILYLNNYGMAPAYRLWKEGLYPGHHLWGCLELAQRGYEILLPEPVSGIGVVRRLRNDWSCSLIAARRLNADDIVYCGHNILLWTTLLKATKAVRCKIVGLLFAREPLLFGNLYDGVIAHTPAAEKKIAKKFPKAICAHISWGMDLDFFRRYAYEPRWFLSCGKTLRDFGVIFEAFRDLNSTVKIVYPQPDVFGALPPNITVESDQNMGERIYVPLAHHYYRYSRAALVTLISDPEQYRAIGVTNLFESMACCRPVIVTRTGALISELDVEKNGIGLWVNPSDALSLRRASLEIERNADRAREMGLKGRRLCEEYYNMDRFAEDLHNFFEKL